MDMGLLLVRVTLGFRNFNATTACSPIFINLPASRLVNHKTSYEQKTNHQKHHQAGRLDLLRKVTMLTIHSKCNHEDQI